MRSSDVIKLLPYDVLHNCILLQYITASLGLDLGYYFHHASHAYWPKKREREGRGYIEELIQKVDESAWFHDTYYTTKLEDPEEIKTLCYNWKLKINDRNGYKDNFIKNWASLIFKHNKFDNHLKFLGDLK